MYITEKDEKILEFVEAVQKTVDAHGEQLHIIFDELDKVRSTFFNYNDTFGEIGNDMQMVVDRLDKLEDRIISLEKQVSFIAGYIQGK